MRLFSEHMSTPNELDGPAPIAGEPASENPNKAVPALHGQRTQPQHVQARPHRATKVLAVLQVMLLIGALGISSYAMYTVATWPDASESNTASTNELLVRTEGRGADGICLYGGSTVMIGLDLNLNQYLDGDEITSETNLCHGLPGLTGNDGVGIAESASLIETVDIPLGNSTCPTGGIALLGGIDANQDGALGEEEITSTDHLCHGSLGQAGNNGVTGLNGAEGMPGAPALVAQRTPLASVCASGLVIDFGLDDGKGEATALDGIMHRDEVISSLKICNQPLFVGPVDDYTIGSTNGVTTGCDQLLWMPEASLLLTAGSNGLNGCELWSSDGTPEGSSMLIEINPTGDASPGRYAGFTLLWNNGHEVVIFDADDGVNGRQLWRTDGTLGGTQRLSGNISTNVDSAAKPVVWNGGVVMLNNLGDLLWSDGSVAMKAVDHPSAYAGMSNEDRLMVDGLESYQASLLYAENGWLWFSAKSQNGVEPYALHHQGDFLEWDLATGDAEPSSAVDAPGGVVVVADNGQGRQLVRLNHDGSHLWLTALIHSGTGNPTERVAEHLGLHRLGDVLVFDALTSGVDPQLWSHNLTQANTTLLSTTILAPGDWAGGVVHQGRLWFDCVAPSIAHEVCSSDGTIAGTGPETDMRAGSASALVRGFAVTEGALFVVASGQINGTETGACLWSLSSGASPTLVYDPWPGATNDSNAGMYGSVHASEHHVMFIANDGQSGHEWHAFSHASLTDEWLIWA